jgi:hypothetical protein
MSAPFKMKGFSGFGNSPIKQTKGPKMPKNHPTTLHTKEESKKSKGELYKGKLWGSWDRPDLKKSFKETWGESGPVARGIKKAKNYITNKLKD